MLSSERLAEIRARIDTDMPGHSETHTNYGVTFTHMAIEARELMDLALEQGSEFIARSKKVDQETARDQAYSFAYWLFRYSGLIDPTAVSDRKELLAEVERLQAENKRLTEATELHVHDL